MVCMYTSTAYVWARTDVSYRYRCAGAPQTYGALRGPAAESVVREL